MVKKIALEEHFLCPDFIEYWNPTVIDLPAERRDKALTRLTDFGELRLAAMDEAGIARAVIGLAGPGVQAERDTATAIRRARAANDFLARQIECRPDRYSGFAHLALQEPRAAAAELERCMHELKFCGASMAIPTDNISITRRSTRSGSAPKRWARSFTCIRSIRSARRGFWTATRDCGARPGNGPSKPDHMRCG